MSESTSSSAFSILLKQLRNKAGFTQAKLSRTSTLSERGISALERGIRKPRFETVFLLADALGLDDFTRAQLLAAANMDKQALSAPSDAPVLAPVQQSRPPALPLPLTRLLGREREMDIIGRMIGENDTRLVTVTGPGGVGKTRFALQLAANASAQFPDGVWYVGLARLMDPAFVVPTIARALSLQEQGDQSIAEAVCTYLRDKILLLVLDNFEQVVAAASQVAEFLATCPGVKVLVTSRVALRLHGEREYTLHPLALPDRAHLPPIDRLGDYAAVALFIERAQASRADFQVTDANAPAVVEICYRLDGLPLPIELAAARVKLLPPPALLRRMKKSLPILTGGARDREGRQQTMRNTLAWSYNLLLDEEQALFRRLAVFVGGCTLEAAEAVCAMPENAEPLGLDLLDGLSALVDQSLIQQHEDGDEPRFGMLHVIREFALEQLEASGELPTLDITHAHYYQSLAEQSAPHLRGKGAAACFHRMRTEYDNLRAALYAFERAGNVTGALELATALGLFWVRDETSGEGRGWFARLLAHESIVPATGRDHLAVTRAKALARASSLAWVQQDLRDASRLGEEALAVAHICDDPWALAEAYDAIGLADLDEMNLEQAEHSFTKSITYARRAHDRVFLGTALNHKALTVCAMGDFERSEVLAKECLAISVDAGDVEVQASCLNLLAGINAAAKGDFETARSQARQGLALGLELGYRPTQAISIAVLAIIALLEGHGEDAARLYGSVASVLARGGGRLIASVARVVEEAIPMVRTQLGEDTWAAAYAAGKALSPDEAIAEALGEERASQFVPQLGKAGQQADS